MQDSYNALASALFHPVQALSSYRGFHRGPGPGRCTTLSNSISQGKTASHACAKPFCFGWPALRRGAAAPCGIALRLFLSLFPYFPAKSVGFSVRARRTFSKKALRPGPRCGMIKGNTQAVHAFSACCGRIMEQGRASVFSMSCAGRSAAPAAPEDGSPGFPKASDHVGTK